MLAQAYLDPRHFTPDAEALRAAGVDPEAPYTVLRVVRWAATHDVGRRGSTPAQIQRIARRLGRYGRVYVTSERPLPPDLEPLRARIPPARLHDLLAFARLCLAEGGTVSVEAALLGTPAVLCATYDFGYLLELEQTYGLITRAPSLDQAVDAAESLLGDPDARGAWRRKRDRLFAETDDVLERMRSGRGSGRRGCRRCRMTRGAGLRLGACLQLHGAHVRNYLQPVLDHADVAELSVFRAAPQPEWTPPHLRYATAPSGQAARRLSGIYRRCRAAVCAGRLDAVLAFNPIPYGLVAAAAARGRLPYSLSFIGSDLYGRPHEWAWRIFRRVLRNAAWVTVTGEALRSEVVRLGATAGRTMVLPHAVDLERFRPNGPVAGEPACDVLFVGHLIARKRVDRSCAPSHRSAGGGRSPPCASWATDRSARDSNS